MEENSEEQPKKRKKYVTQKGIELDNLLTAAKEYKFSYKPTAINLKNAAEVAEVTQDSCVYPNLYFDNDETCVTCKLYDHCNCKLKNLGKTRKKKD